MAPVIHSAFGQPDVVQTIISEVKSLSDESLDADEGIEHAKTSAAALAVKHKANITALDGLPSSIDEFAKHFNSILWATRDGATSVASRLDLFVNVMIALVEDIETPEDRDDAVKELKYFHDQKDPLLDKPLNGFPGATKKFSYIWAISASDADGIKNVLEKTTDIKQTVKELTQVLSTVKVGCGKVQEALKGYAIRIVGN